MDQQTEQEVSVQIDKLRARFLQLSIWLGETVRDMEVSGRPPSSEILHDLQHSRAKFVELRDIVLLQAQGQGIEPMPQPEHLISVDDLAHLFAKVDDVRMRSVKRRHICERATAVLERVLAIGFHDGTFMAPLEEAKAKAAALHQRARALETIGAFEGTEAEALYAHEIEEMEHLSEGHHPFCDLIVQVDENQDLDDDRWGDLTGRLTRAFGKTLATAAARGKLVLGATPDPAVATVPVAAEEARPENPATVLETPAIESPPLETPTPVG